MSVGMRVRAPLKNCLKNKRLGEGAQEMKRAERMDGLTKASKGSEESRKSIRHKAIS